MKNGILMLTTTAALAASTTQAGVRLAVHIGHRPGPRVISVTRPVVAHPLALRVVLGPSVTVAPGFGRLKVEVEPDRARVFIDGRDQGRGDDIEAVRAGLHTVRVVLPDGREASQIVRIEPGRLTTVRLDLT